MNHASAILTGMIATAVFINYSGSSEPKSMAVAFIIGVGINMVAEAIIAIRGGK